MSQLLDYPEAHVAKSYRIIKVDAKLARQLELLAKFEGIDKQDLASDLLRAPLHKRMAAMHQELGRVISEDDDQPPAKPRK